MKSQRGRCELYDPVICFLVDDQALNWAKTKCMYGTIFGFPFYIKLDEFK